MFIVLDGTLGEQLFSRMGLNFVLSIEAIHKWIQKSGIWQSWRSEFPSGFDAGVEAAPID